MYRADLHFDLRAAVLSAQGKAAAGQAAPATRNAGLVFAAGPWDLYVRALRSPWLIWVLDAVDTVDILMRTAFFAFCAGGAVEFWMVDKPKPASLDAIAGGFVAVSYAGVLLYVLERLV